MEQKTFKRNVEELLSIPSECWYLYAMEKDLLGCKLSRSEQDRLIKKAAACGTQLAAATKKKYSTIHIKECCSFFDIDLCYKDFEKCSEDRIEFAFFEPPQKVVLYNNIIEPAEELLQQLQIDQWEGSLKLENILVAHEWFHFFEEKNKTAFFTRATKIPVFSFGPFKRVSSLRALSEIAAMSFAKEWNGLTFDPFALNFVLAYPFSIEIAMNHYQRIVEFAANI